MKGRKTSLALLFVLLGVFLLINSTWVWKWMYPIKYKEEVKQASERFQVDPLLLLAIIKAESGFDTKLVSRKGAIGLMQVMPDTAEWIAGEAGFQITSVEYLDEPRVNIDYGAWYVQFLLKHFDGNRVKAIAAYNAGPGIVGKWLEKGVWNGTEETIDDIPYGETRHYIQRVLYYHKRYKQIYGAEFDKQ